MPCQHRERRRHAGKRDAARHRRGEGRPDDLRSAQDLAAGRRLLGRGRRSLRRPAREERALLEPARRRRDDADRHLSDREDDVRQHRESRCPLPLPPPPLRRLVGRGSALADLQLLPARRLRDEAAVRRRERGDVAAAAAVPVPRRDRVQHATRGARPGIGNLPPREAGGPTIGCVSLRRDRLAAVLRWLRPAAKPAIWIGTT